MSDQDPRLIAEAVGRTYGACKTYQDHGLVETRFHSETPTEMISKVWFTTYFKRPDLFRFAFMIRFGDFPGFPELINVIWSNKKGTHVKSPAWIFGNESSLEMAVAGATGISSASAIRIPALLMPKVLRYQHLIEADRARCNQQESIDGEPCNLISQTAGSRNTKIWISTNRTIVRRIEEYNTIGPNMSAFSQERKQLESTGGVISFLLNKFAEAIAAKTEPRPYTTTTNYQTVLLDEEIPDSWFSEKGKG